MARKILLADDSVTAQNMGRKILADAGYEVITVNNGSAALKKIAEVKPDLVILDVYMPGYSGLEVCQRLKESSDSSRIPVLLTVGKLEPFKPEEAQRVRAEGFIVKPFEASELLSALSKLEDKVVPRSEPSKPGRFARAIAAVEDSGRGRSSEFGEPDDNGWKSRIAFPHKKTEEEEKEADDSPIYNPMNRDLRTVVATPAETSEERKEAKGEKKYNRRKGDRPQPEPAEENSVDVGALVSPGLPQDVTPEEVAAIAAAAAQIKTMQAVLHDEQVPEMQVAPAQVVDAQVPEQPTAETISASVETSTIAAAEPSPLLVQAPVPVEAEASQVTLPHEVPGKAPEAIEEADAKDAPVTMAVATAEVPRNASADASRWTAVSVALDAEDAAISLEQEMQKAYAAFVAEETASIVAPAVIEPATRQDLPATEESSAVQSAGATVINPESDSVSTAALTPEVQVAPAPEPELASSAPQPQVEFVAPATPDIPLAERLVEAAPLAQAAEPIAEPITERVVESIEAISEPVLAPAVPIEQSPVSAEPEVQPSAEAEPPPIEATESSKAYTAFVPAVGRASDRRDRETVIQQEDSLQPDANPELETQDDPDTVKTTAAAWASWRQIRDAGEPKPNAEVARREVETPVDPPADSAAMAVAAGAEQAPQEPQPSAEQSIAEQPGDVASIVDSLLADLRPKLMAEITRKMAEKK